MNSKAILGSESFPNLNELDLSFNHLEGGLVPIRDSSLAESLRVLDVLSCGISANEIATFAKSVHMPNLESLAISGARTLTPKSLTILGESDHFPRLRSLSIALSGNEKGYDALSKMPLMNQLSGLRIHGGNLDDKCVTILLKSDVFERLSWLYFYTTTINSENRQRLRDHFGERFVE